MYGYDSISGLAVLRVYAKDIDEEIKKSLKPASLKNIEEMNDGDKLVYVGNPYGNGRLMYTEPLREWIRAIVIMIPFTEAS